MDKADLKIITKNYLLKLLDKDCYKFYMSLYQDNKLMSFVGKFSKEQLEKSFNESVRLNQNSSFKRLTFIIYNHDIKIGIITLIASKKNSEQCEIGTIVRFDWLNKGVAAEVVQAIINHAFVSLGVKKIYAKYLVNNYSAAQVLKKLNFIIEETKDAYNYCFIKQLREG